METFTHLIKLSVGTESIESLVAWQASRAAQTSDGLPRHVTRMYPKREEEILAGGSIYWVFQGLIQCRQRILRLERITGEDGIDRCAMVLDPEIRRVAPAPRRPFQGWRYLAPSDAPPDMKAGRKDEEPLPAALAGALAEIGVL
ncbi:lysophospholipase [Salipiger pallidus]|uniref:Lysophospholipase n=1 Tax=Salipiger pallidus TaxID=1775170 RepID=A0A8J2ZML2_9RHOB|nr:DUF1489 domain-containing protein [Salipiger pallidus]GGG82993.1 lysophospholipase [Salipiger pallidus]